jgi:hypothetical protein
MLCKTGRRCFGNAVVFAVALLAACVDSPLAPIPTPDALNVTTNLVNKPPLDITLEGEAWVCEDGAEPAGSFTFAVSVDGGPATNHSVARGTCVMVHSVSTVGSTRASVSVTENVPADWTLQSITIESNYQDRHDLYEPAINSPNASGTIRNDVGVVFTFNNDRLFAGATLLIIDEDGIDNGLRLNRTGGGITPSGPSFWTDREVNDDIAAYGLRSILRYFADPINNGRTITVVTGQTGDEGWFAPACIPRKWLGSWVSDQDDTCLSGTDRATATNNFVFSGKKPFGSAPNSWNLPQSRLDKIPHVLPLRARGLVSLIGKDVCAVVYDSDIGINYDHDKSLGVNGNLQGSTLGIAAFHVNTVRTLNRFSSSTLPEVQITVLSAADACGPFELFNPPVPNSSSEPNDRVVENLAGLGSKAYLRFNVFSNQPTFF